MDHNLWPQMLETKYVGDNYQMLLKYFAFFVTNCSFTLRNDQNILFSLNNWIRHKMECSDKCENSQNPIYSNFWHFMEVQHKHDDENLQKIKIFQNIGRYGCAMFFRVQRSTDKWWRNSRWGLYFQTPQNRTFSTQKRHFKLKFWKIWNFDSFEK